MKDRISIETTPVMEDCVSIEDPDYLRKATLEAETYRDQLLRAWNDNRMPRRPVPRGVDIVIKRNRHDFGVYLTLEIIYDDASNEQEQAAFWFEENQPERWDQQAKTRLGLGYENC